MVAAATLCGAVNAQIVQTTSSQISYRKEIKPVKEPKIFGDYNRWAISYNNLGLSAGDDDLIFDKNSMGLNGFGFEYVHGFTIVKDKPMYIEVGGKLQFSQGTKKSYDYSYYYGDYEVKAGFRYLSLSIPLNYVYRFKITDDFSVLPYTGFNFKINLMGDAGESYSEYDDDIEWYSMFDDDEFDPTWKRFQMGWNIGAGIQYRKLYFGLGYTVDMIKAYKSDYDYSVRSGNFALTLGIQY